MSDLSARLASYLSSLAQFRVTADRTLSNIYELTVTVTGNGVGSVRRDPDRINFMYKKDELVSVTAIAQDGSKFVRWTGDLSGTHFDYNIKMDGPKSITAEFEKIALGTKSQLLSNYVNEPAKKSFTLNVTITGSGSGTISRTPHSEGYEKGQVVLLVANADPGSKFVGWKGDLQSGHRACNLRMNSDASVSAEFARVMDGPTLHRAESVESEARTSRLTVASQDASGKPIGHSLHFMDHGDGTVTDTRSGLMWMRPAFGQRWENGTCSGVAEALRLIEVKATPCDFAGYLDWRLPTIDELKGLIYPGKNPALDEQAFPAQSGRYFWTSSCQDDGSTASSGHPIIFALRAGVLGYCVSNSSREHVRFVRKDSSSDTLKIGITQGESEPVIQSPNRLTVFPASSGEPALKPACNPVQRIGHSLHFMDHGDGTVTDTRSGLMWIRPAFGQRWENNSSTGDAKTMSLVEAKTLRCDFAGHKNWRLPTIAELKGLIYPGINPALDDQAFPMQSGRYFWTTSCKDDTSKISSGHPIIFALRTGSLGYSVLEHSHENVRLVRKDSSPDTLTIGIPQGESEPIMQSPNRFTSLPALSGEPVLQPVSNQVKHIGFEGRFIDHCDGTVTDTRSGLMWRRCARGQTWHGSTCSGSAPYLNLVDGAKLNPSFAGYDDWRLPELTELKTLISQTGLTIDDAEVFPNMRPGNYWTSSPNKAGQAWQVDFATGKAYASPLTSLAYVRLVRISHNVTTSGTGNGFVTRTADFSSPTSVTLTAQAAVGSKFKEWHGDANGTNPVCVLTSDSVKSVDAEFVPAESFSLSATTIGTGAGRVTWFPEIEKYVEGSEVSLTAEASAGSKFTGWQGDASGQNAIYSLTMDSAKSVSAEFTELEFFDLGVFTTGSGKGVIYLQDPDAEKYMEGSVVTLTAEAANGSEFKRWSGSASGSDSTCTVTMDAAKTVTAEFVQLESFALDVSATGTGSGRVTRSVDRRRYFLGSTVTLTAQADEGSIFTGWYGDAGGLDDACTVTINSKTSVTAEFEKVVVADFGVSVEFESAQDATMKDGSTATIFYLLIRNKGGKQIRITLPMATYQNRLGEEIEQSFWLTGLVIGGNGSTIRAGAFRKTGLGFHKSQLESMSKGDRLHVSVDQSKSSSTLCFTFKCIDADKPFVLVNASSEGKDEPADGVETLPAMTELLVRIESLEESLADVLRRFDELQSSRPPAVHNSTSQPAAPAPTFADVLAWLATQDRMTVAQLRVRLLPLDLLPGAVINEINERALDLMGELALEEAEDEIVVAKEILDEVLANWAHD